MEGGRLTWTNENWNSACGPLWNTPRPIRWTASWPPAAPQTGTVLPFEAPKKKRRWAPLAVAAALALVICGGAFGITSWRGANAVDSVVMLDVNPSLSMEVSAQERVLSVTPFNRMRRSSWATWT